MIPKDAINAALKMLPVRMSSKEALVMMSAIGYQESRFTHRKQMGNGPANGFWQFERGGGVRGVLGHAATKDHAQSLCIARGVIADSTAVWKSLEFDDVLAAGFARLLLFSDPKSLPAVGDEKSAWDLYIRTWRPGKPHPEKWPDCYAKALSAVDSWGES